MFEDLRDGVLIGWSRPILILMDLHWRLVMSLRRYATHSGAHGPKMPPNKPLFNGCRHARRLGRHQNGVDMFDCVRQLANARNEAGYFTQYGDIKTKMHSTNKTLNR
jgi:tRNA-guanine family transglycosylase